MKYNILKCYKDPNVVGITTINNKLICNIFVKNLLQICENYDEKNGIVTIYKFHSLLNNARQIFETKETIDYLDIVKNLNINYSTEL